MLSTPLKDRGHYFKPKKVTVMAKILLTYDVKKTSDTIHTELKKQLIDTYRYSPKFNPMRVNGVICQI
jgi:hypothetical protein